MLQRAFINNRESGPSSPVKQVKEVFMDGMSLGGPSLGPLIDEEFSLNVVGMGLKEVFPSEFEMFMGQFPFSGPTRQKTT